MLYKCTLQEFAEYDYKITIIYTFSCTNSFFLFNYTYKFIFNIQQIHLTKAVGIISFNLKKGRLVTPYLQPYILYLPLTLVIIYCTVRDDVFIIHKNGCNLQFTADIMYYSITS